MTASFRKIDYALRPAKHTERRMLCDLFRKLSTFHKLSNYTYVGFGAIAFSDFILFHRNLGIRDMVSIEKSTGAIPRIEANKPFNTIKIEGKPSSVVLPKLSWKKPHILWLDYDDPLTTDMLLDVSTVAHHANSGTTLALSFQCEEAREIQVGKESEQNPFHLFSTTFGRERVSNDLDETDLRGWKFGALGRKILLEEIEAILALRNSSLAVEDQVKFQEICTIEYSDGAKMLTITGVFYTIKDKEVLKQCEFNNLDYIPKPRKPIRIDIPKLTLKEIRTLERQLPLHGGTELKCGLVPSSEAAAFAKLYRYLPNFAVLEN